MPGNSYLPRYTTSNNTNTFRYSGLADWERELLEQDYIQSQARQEVPVPNLDDDLDDLIRSALDDRPKRAPKKNTDTPPTALEMFKILAIGDRFFLVGDSIHMQRRYLVRTKIGDNTYSTDTESTIRHPTGWRSDHQLVRAL
jgi:hypothetical protein